MIFNISRWQNILFPASRGGKIIWFFIFSFLLLWSDGGANTILFQDNFQNGDFNKFTVEGDWQVVQEGENFFLRGASHSFATAGQSFYRNYSFEAKVRLTSQNSATFFNFRAACERYGIGIATGGLSMLKTQPCDTHTELLYDSNSIEVGKWYTVRIVGKENNIKVFVNDDIKFDYTDNNPVLTGSIGFETLDEQSVDFDDVVVSTDELSGDFHWTSTGGPLGGIGYDVRINHKESNILYFTDINAGVLKSINKGITWSPYNDGITVKGGTTGDTTPIFSLTIDPNNPNILWAGTNAQGANYGIFKSIDAGSTWALRTNGLSLSGENGLVFRGFTIQEGDSNIVYAQAEVPTDIDGKEFNRVKGRVYKTNDGGGTWDLIWEGNNLARYLIIDPTDNNTLYLSTGIFDREAYNSDCANGSFGGVGVLKSIDAGQTWFPVNNGLTDLYVGTLRMHPSNPQILFAGTGNNACSNGYLNSGLFKTVDGGVNWSKVIAYDCISAVNFSTSAPNILYAGSISGFYESTDCGTIWVRHSTPNGYGPKGVVAGFPIDVTIDPQSPNTLYVNNYGGGVFRSIDGAKTWESWSKGYTGANISDVAIAGASTVYSTARSGPFISSNFGDDWIGIANGDATFTEWTAVAANGKNPHVVLISEAHQGTILRSTDCGKHFDEVLRHPLADAGDPNKRQGFKTIDFSTSNPDIAYSGLAKAPGLLANSSPMGTVLYKSIDSGRSFFPLPSILDGKNVNQLVIDYNNPDVLFAATTNGVYKSDDGASSWIFCHTLGNRNIESLDVSPHDTGIIVAGEVFGGIWISQDGGLSWSGPNNEGFGSPNPYISALTFDPTDSNTVFAGALYSGIYKSENKGVTWAPFPDWKMSGLTNKAVTDIAIGDDVIYAGTQEGGVFRYARGPLNTIAPTCGARFPWAMFFPALQEK